MAFYTNFVNANAAGAPPPSQILYQFQSGGDFKQNQLIVNGSIRMGTKLSLFGYYVLNYANSDTSGASFMPSDPHDISIDYGRAAFDYRQRLFMGGTVGLPKGFSAHGLRKAACRRLAEAGCSANVIASISGHKSLDEIELYTRAADQVRMAREGMAALIKQSANAK